jgi:hypothetical protein
MKLTHPRRLLAGICVAIATCTAPPAAPAAPAPPAVPDEIAVRDGHKPFLLGHAVGVQIYTCTTVAGGFAWGPATPRADLLDDHGSVIVRHFGGPSWQAKDGSTVVAQRVRDESVDATSIPWLLLSATGTPGADGDRLAGTTYIQRIATTGGRAPAAEPCNASTVGNAVPVPYTADYVFWKARTA